jgi:hypothetical protein
MSSAFITQNPLLTGQQHDPFSVRLYGNVNARHYLRKAQQNRLMISISFFKASQIKFLSIIFGCDKLTLVEQRLDG